MPKAWHGPASDEKNQLVHQNLYAAGLGLIIGLALVVAGLVWLAGWVGTFPTSEVRKSVAISEKPAKFREAATRWSAVAKLELARRDDMISPELGEASRVLDRPATAVTTPRSSPELLVEAARQRIERGDGRSARPPCRRRH
jgi:hypothetical protein